MTNIIKDIKLTKGFTLVEMLVVVLIIGILAAIAVPKYQKAVIKSRFSTLKNITHAIAQSEERYFLANSQYTNNFNDLDINIGEDNTDRAQTFFDWGRCVIYKNSDSTNMYVNCAYTDIKMSYQIFGNNTSRKGQILCVLDSGLKSTSIQYQICKAETGHNSLGNEDSQHYFNY